MSLGKTYSEQKSLQRPISCQRGARNRIKARQKFRAFSETPKLVDREWEGSGIESNEAAEN